MKLHSFSICVFGSALFLLQMPLAISLEAIFTEQSTISLATSEEVQAYIEKAEENIRNATEQLRSISLKGSTFEDVLNPFQRLTGEISFHLAMLKHVEQTDSSLEWISSQGFQYLRDLSIEILQNSELCQMIMNAAENILNETSLSSQHFQANGVFLDKNQNLYLHLPKIAEEKNHREESFTILYLNAQPLLHNALSLGELMESMRSSSADIICLQGIFSEDNVNTLYKKLKQDDISFVLCKDLRISQESHESQEFASDLFIQHYSANLNKEKENIHISSLWIGDLGLLATVKMGAPYYLNDFFKNKSSIYGDENCIILCKNAENNAGASARADTEGNASVEVHASHTEKDDQGGSLSFGVKGEISRDNQGNTTGEVRTSIDRKW